MAQAAKRTPRNRLLEDDIALECYMKAKPLSSTLWAGQVPSPPSWSYDRGSFATPPRPHSLRAPDSLIAPLSPRTPGHGTLSSTEATLGPPSLGSSPAASSPGKRAPYAQTAAQMPPSPPQDAFQVPWPCLEAFPPIPYLWSPLVLQKAKKILFLLRAAPKDHEPPTATNRHQPPTTNRQGWI